MTILYQDNFDSDTVGALPSGWANKIGTWQVGTNHPVSSPNSLGSITNADGDVVHYAGLAARADMQIDTKGIAQLQSGKYPFVGHVLRSDSANANHYAIVFTGFNGTTGTIAIFKKVSGTYTQIASQSVSLVFSTGASIYIRSKIVGSTISVYMGNGGLSGSPLITTSDSSVTAAGYPGLYNGLDATTLSLSADDFVYDDAAGGANALDTTKCIFSPYNWNIGSNSAKTINAGAYFKTIFGGTSCALNFDLTNVIAPYPEIMYRVDGYGAWYTANIAASVTVNVPTDTSGYASKPGHFLEVMVKSTTETQSRWSPQATGVFLTGITLDTGMSLSLPTGLPLHALYLGDSITEGVRTVNNTAANDTDRNDAQQGWAFLSATALGAEVGVVGFGATGFITAGSGGVPALTSSYNNLYSGVARSFTPVPDYIVINDGVNDVGSVTSAATTVLNGLLAATPSTTKIIVLRPFKDSTHTAELQAAIAACTAPARCTFVDSNAWFVTANSSDGLHPYGVENITNLAPRIAAAIKPIIGGAGTPSTTKTVTVTFQNVAGALQANLTGLKWTWSDVYGTITDSGSGATTNGSGVFSVTVHTNLASGGIGYLNVTNESGTINSSDIAFFGPAQVA